MNQLIRAIDCCNRLQTGMADAHRHSKRLTQDEKFAFLACAMVINEYLHMQLGEAIHTEGEA